MEETNTLYKKLIMSLKEEISNMDVGDKIPSERQLCNIYDISRTTVRNAITDLEHSGLLERIQGKGTFVAKPKDNRQNLSNYYSFTETTREIGKTPKTVILEYHIRTLDKENLEILEAEEYELFIDFTRLRLADNEPMLIETTYLKYDEFPDITKKLLEELPLYEIFEQKYNRKIVKVTETFSATVLNSEQASHLKAKEHSSCLKITRFSYDMGNNVIEFTRSYAPEDRFNYETTYYPK